MIPAPYGVFTADWDHVLAFDDGGEPLVLGKGGLVSTSSPIDMDDERYELVSTMPAAEGWRALFIFLNPDDRHILHIKPLIGWGTCRSGTSRTTVSGLVLGDAAACIASAECDLSGDFWYYLQPGEEPPSAEDVATEAHDRRRTRDHDWFMKGFIGKMTGKPYHRAPKYYRLSEDQKETVDAATKEWDEKWDQDHPASEEKKESWSD